MKLKTNSICNTLSIMPEKYSSNFQSNMNKGNTALIAQGTHQSLQRLAVFPTLRPVFTTTTHSTKTMHRGIRDTAYGVYIVKEVVEVLWLLTEQVVFFSFLVIFLVIAWREAFQSLVLYGVSHLRQTVPIVQACSPFHFLSSHRVLCLFIISVNITLKPGCLYFFSCLFLKIFCILHPNPSSHSPPPTPPTFSSPQQTITPHRV